MNIARDVTKHLGLTIAALAFSMWHVAPADGAFIFGASVNATFNSQGPNGGNNTVTLWQNANGTGQSESASLSQGGAMDWTFTSGKNPDNSTFSDPFVGIDNLVHVNNTFITFCIEFTQDINFKTSYNYTISNLAGAPQPAWDGTTGSGGMGSTAATQISQLWAQYFPGIESSANPNVDASAFQLAIWKLEYDQAELSTASNFSATSLFTDGHLRVTNLSNASAIEAAAMIQWVESNKNAQQADLIALVSHSAQDQIGAVVMPEPATVTMWCLMGGVCLAVCGFRRRLLA